MRGARAIFVAAALAVAVGPAACSSSGSGSYHLPPPGDGGAKPPSVGTPNTNGNNPDVSLGVPSGTVNVVINSPMANGNPLSVNGPVDLSATVTITGGTDLVDPQSVHATIAAAGTTTTLATAPLVGPTGAMANLYTGRLPLFGLKGGDYTITVTAASTTNQAGSATVTIKVDAGPIITVLSPLPGRHYKGSIVVLVAVDPDLGAPVAAIGAMPVGLKKTDTPGLYRAIFDLTMPIPLEGEQLFVVTAQDAAHLTSEVKFPFVVDLVGPTITATTPPPGTIVGGVITLGAQIADDAGINVSTLQVLVGDQKTPQFRLPLKANGAGTYIAQFDTNNLTKCGLAGGVCIVRPTISFRASDNLGNESTVSYTIAVDNIPPIADLQPPRIRVTKLDEGYRCSTEFDPLDFKSYMGDVPHDNCQVPQMFDLRARIEDKGNYATGIKAVPISLVDENRTAVYVLDTVVNNGVAQPLVVDTDGDGFCDDLNPQLQPTTEPLTGPKQVLKIQMRPVPVGGTADFYLPDYTAPGQPATLPGCMAGRAADPPLELCTPGPQPTIAISYANLVPAIWSIEPIAPEVVGYCFGSQLDTKANNILPPMPPPAGPQPSGWKCIAVVTSDNVGNRSTSTPIRVYLPDYQNGGSQAYCPMPPAGAGAPPNCTGTYNRATGILSQTACKARDFKPKTGNIELCFEGDCCFRDDIASSGDCRTDPR